VRLVVAQHGTGLNLIREQAELFGTALPNMASTSEKTRSAAAEVLFLLSRTAGVDFLLFASRTA
jgi:hypothetical protein